MVGGRWPVSGADRQDTLASIGTLPNADVEAVAPLRPANPENVRRVEALVSAEQFDFLFPLRAPEYTYRGFLQAFAKFPAICATYTDGRDSNAICRKTLATMVAHFAQETGAHDVHSPVPEWRQALVHVREMGWSEDRADGYAGECNPETWQGYNYGPFSDAMSGTVRTLPIYWEENYDRVPGNVGGKSYQCKLVGYQTPYSALKPADYVKCVIDKFPNVDVVE